MCKPLGPLWDINSVSTALATSLIQLVQARETKVNMLTDTMPRHKQEEKYLPLAPRRTTEDDGRQMETNPLLILQHNPKSMTY